MILFPLEFAQVGCTLKFWKCYWGSLFLKWILVIYTKQMSWSVCFRMAKFVWFKPRNSSSFYLSVAKFSVMNTCICRYKKFKLTVKLKLRLFLVMHIFCIGLVFLFIGSSISGSWRRKWQPTPVFLSGEPRDWEAWWATVHRVTKSQTWLKWLSMNACINGPYTLNSKSAMF